MRTSAHARRQQSGPLDEDERLLKELGYTQQLHRRMGAFGNFAASLSVISIMSGTLLLFGFGLNSGGPAVVMWGWLAVGPLVLCLAAALAEITSRYPTSGGLYYMARQLGGERWSWYTGWLNLLGLLAGIAAQDYGIATFTAAWANLQWGIVPSPGGLLALYAVILVLHAVLNLFGARLMNVLTSVSAWWHLAGAVVIISALTFIPSHHQPAGFVFSEFTNNTGWGAPVYVILLGMLLPCFALAGYDTSAHLSEETSRASVAAARGIVRSVAVSWVAGGILLAALIFAVQDYAATLASPTGVPVAQIFLDALGVATAKALLLVIIVAQFLCGYTVTASASRMIYAFSRDGALPGWARWQKVSRRTAIPANAVWLAICVAFVLALPSLYSASAFSAVTAISVVGFTPAYAIPVLLRLRHRDKWAPGPWHLGRWSRPIGWTAVLWAGVVTALFMLPQTSPVSATTFNYTPVATLAALALAALWWRIGRRSYVERRSSTVQTQDEELEGIV
ncbi:amino acid permease [Streptomyces sp. WAC 06783]|uniref:amino acid permease n=1 Tax=unclassified Streptomyces TaxID=2593676 RepID=UPI000F73FBD7|nr:MULTISPECIES: amino acid permease [unclassified Streptomyces]RSO09716.1 amino acid permease [Streptomyces sp. WAC 06783]RSO28507.1 amino acid permease [Streptomyces sp. WAC 06725]